MARRLMRARPSDEPADGAYTVTKTVGEEWMRARPSDEPADGAAGRLTAGDWRALRRILPAQDADGGGVQLLERLRLRIAEARAKGGREAFEAVLRRLTDTEAFVSARLMREIGAVDAAADAGRRRPAGRGVGPDPRVEGLPAGGPHGRGEPVPACPHHRADGVREDRVGNPAGGPCAPQPRQTGSTVRS